MNNLGNTRLVRNGIEQEKADLRFHVSVITRHVFVFEPKYALEAIESHNYKQKPAYTGDLITAKGYLVPPRDIKKIRWYRIPDDIFAEAYFKENASTSIKGKKAEIVVNQMIERGIISTALKVVHVGDKEMQFNGEDLISLRAESLSIKCDWRSGPKRWGGYWLSIYSRIRMQSITSILIRKVVSIT